MKNGEQKQNESRLTPKRSSEDLKRMCCDPEGGAIRGHGLPVSKGYPDDKSFNLRLQKPVKTIRAGKK